ncbi:MAG: glucosamine-6-phosphate deaminase [Fastidiosipila sp.]|nr:glucosamine-6-phosphate deaminase [Fastidiosipila sp.]
MNMHKLKKDLTTICVLENRDDLGKECANDIASRILTILSTKDIANVVFASAPSQKETLNYLVEKDLPWDRIRAFHMDEYIGLGSEHPSGFGNILKRDFFSKRLFHEVYYLKDQGSAADEICQEYSRLLKEYPIDIVVLGIGENGHLAFNDPPVADFNDPQIVKVVELDLVCRQQQVNDGCFATLDEVPTHAVTITMSAIGAAKHQIAAVPGKTKAKAMRDFFFAEISEASPATMMRTLEGSAIYVDNDSMSAIDKDELEELIYE